MNKLTQKSGSANQRKPIQWLSVLIVPEGRTPYRYKIRMVWLKVATAGAILFLLVVLAAGLSFSSLLRKAIERDSLLTENAKLLVENQRVSQLAQDVEKSRHSLERIVKSLGGKLDLSESVMRDSL